MEDVLTIKDHSISNDAATGIDLDEAPGVRSRHTEPAAPPVSGYASERSAAIDRILSRAGTAVSEGETQHHDRDGEQSELSDRQALRRVGGLSTELQDVTEVEYRQLRLE